MFNIVLVEPEIPANTGNIARTCVLTGSRLHLVGPLGFSLADKYLKRAGLDYWQYLDYVYYDDFQVVRESFPDSNFFFATTKAQRNYTEINYQAGDFLVFGKESQGLPVELVEKNFSNCIKIPMLDYGRSLNLSNAAAIIVYEAWRQLGFKK